MKEKIRRYLLHKLLTRDEQIVVAYGGLNKDGRDLFTKICVSAYKQTKDAHPEYPEMKPRQLSSFAKRFLCSYVVKKSIIKNYIKHNDTKSTK